jgi:two-component system chemotaxis response regulator CheB
VVDPKVRVLVVDDSAVMRRIVSDALRSDPSIEVVGTASDGLQALAKVVALRPDVVTLDLEMPELDGLTTLTELRKTHPRLPVVIFSSLSQRGAVKTLEALSRGANDYVAKPMAGTTEDVAARVREELVTKVKGLAGLLPPPSLRGAPPSSRGLRETDPPLEVLAMGASTGGPNALDAIVPRLPSDFPAAVLLVQHMPPHFTRILAERLDARCALRVVEAAGGEVVEPGTVYVAPGDHHLEVERRGGRVVTVLSQGAPEHSVRPSVDVLFRSVAREYPRTALAVVLTGMGRDGRDGCRVLRDAGARVMVQDEASSVVWGMPGGVATAGYADEVLPLDRLGDAILRRAFAGRR